MTPNVVPEWRYDLPRLPDLRNQRAIQNFTCFLGTIRELIANRLKAEDETLKTLQERVVQVASNPRALAYAFFQTHVELRRQLPHPQFMYSQSIPRNAATHAALNQFVWYQAGGITKSSAAPSSFHTPLLLQARTRNL